jgi:hypothetical protein
MNFSIKKIHKPVEMIHSLLEFHIKCPLLFGANYEATF